MIRNKTMRGTRQGRRVKSYRPNVFALEPRLPTGNMFSLSPSGLLLGAAWLENAMAGESPSARIAFTKSQTSSSWSDSYRDSISESTPNFRLNLDSEGSFQTSITPADNVRPSDRKSTRLNSSHIQKSRMPSSA